MSVKIDYMHPLVLNVTDISIQFDNIRDAKNQLEDLQKKLKEIKSEEKNKQEIGEEFLENNLHTIL